MGAVPSTPRWSSRPQDTTEYLIATFVGDKSFPLSSDFWQKLLESLLHLQLPSDHVRQACEAFEVDSRKENKVQRRLAQNREAARKSHLRKKAYVQQLESTRSLAVKQLQVLNELTQNISSTKYQLGKNPRESILDTLPTTTRDELLHSY